MALGAFWGLPEGLSWPFWGTLTGPFEAFSSFLVALVPKTIDFSTKKSHFSLRVRAKPGVPSTVRGRPGASAGAPWTLSRSTSRGGRTPRTPPDAPDTPRHPGRAWTPQETPGLRSAAETPNPLQSRSRTIWGYSLATLKVVWIRPSLVRVLTLS